MGYGEFANFIEKNINVSQDSGLSPEESKIVDLKILDKFLINV